MSELVRAELRLTIEDMALTMSNFINDNVLPDIDRRLRAAVEGYDLDGEVERILRSELRAIVSRVVTQRVQAALWKREAAITKAVEKATKEALRLDAE